MEPVSFAADGELPAELTVEMYCRVHAKIWLIMRHDLYVAIQKRKEELHVSGVLPGADFARLLGQIAATFENCRLTVFCKMMGDDEIEEDKMHEYM